VSSLCVHIVAYRSPCAAVVAARVVAPRAASATTPPPTSTRLSQVLCVFFGAFGLRRVG